MVRFCCSCTHCGNLWIEVSMGTLTDLWLCTFFCNKLWWTIWYAVACVLDQTIRASLSCPCASLICGHPWPCLWFSAVPSLYHFQQKLITADWEHPEELQVRRCSERFIYLSQSGQFVNLAQILMLVVMVIMWCLTGVCKLYLVGFNLTLTYYYC